MTQNCLRLLAHCLLLFPFALHAAAEGIRLIVPQAVLAEPRMDAAPVAHWPAQTRAEATARQGGWVRVRQGGAEGWVRVLAVSRDATGLTAARVLEQFSTGSTAGNDRIVAVAGFRGAPLARPSAHALILTIGEYQGRITPLKGVRHDAVSGILMARGLGVPEDQIISLGNEALTVEGLHQAFNQLDRRVKTNDEVFVYYSGHGARLKSFDGRADRCAEALVSVDGQGFMDTELSSRLDHLAQRARRVVVFLDACHSGGVTTRAVSGADAFTGKAWTPVNAKTGEAESCEHPSNALTRGLQEAKAGSGKLNFVHIAAARPDEVALDSPDRGGLATQAWLECLGGAAKDLDGSAGISVEELRICAQPIIDRMTRGNTRFGAHHISLTGNNAMVLKGAPEPEPAPVQATPPVQADAPAPQQAAVNPVAVLKDLLANRDDRRQVRLGSDRPSLRVGERIRFTLTTSHPGYVYLLMVGTTGQEFDLLFPNRKDSGNFMRAGDTWTLPRPGWGIAAQGPAGKNHLLAIVSDTPRDFSALGMKPTGPFSALKANRMTARDIQLVTALTTPPERPECNLTGGKRTLAVVDECSAGYGADLLVLDELNP